MLPIIHEPSWQSILTTEFQQPYFQALWKFVVQAYQTRTCYPKAEHIFSSFEKCPWNEVKVVIIGQDPYHGPGQADGLSFSVPAGIKIPPSLRNIFKEIQRDLEIPIPKDGNLDRWARQGVLLLNATLTVEAHRAGSHQKKGWETFTDYVIQYLNDNKSHIAFLLWGNYAQKKGTIIDAQKHMILRSVHPSPLSAHQGFIGNSHFSQVNQYLQFHGQKTIHW